MRRAQGMTTGVRRRHVIGIGTVALAAPVLMRTAAAHAGFGPVRPPLPAPPLGLIDVDGKALVLPQALRGRVTALQLMFTGCSAVCPIQGAVFADTQQKLAAAGTDMRLLSVSIDPLGDDAKALRAWLARFGAQPLRWTAAVPGIHDVNRLLDFLRGRADGADRHTPQAYLFNRNADLVYRTADVPSSDELVKLMQQTASMR